MASPDSIFEKWNGMEDDFQGTIRKTFNLPDEDDYVYVAESFQKTLSQVQEATATGKYKWNYRSHDQQVTPISDADVTAYTSIFSSTTDTAKTLKSFDANAKKASPRSLIANYLISRRLSPAELKISKTKKAHTNPYLDVWTWSCRETGFIGPLNDRGYAHPNSAKLTHPILPILYHYFGCVCPTYEALSVISFFSTKLATAGVLDMASGNGYWTYLLRRHGVDAIAVDNMQAQWRYTWIGDTVKANGVTYLKKHAGASDRLLLMVYMITRGDFTKQVLRGYRGRVIVIAGTQNENRFTGFENVTVEQYFEAEMSDWELVVRVALPSFAGKDEGLFVYTRISK